MSRRRVFTPPAVFFIFCRRRFQQLISRRAFFADASASRHAPRRDASAPTAGCQRCMPLTLSLMTLTPAIRRRHMLPPHADATPPHCRRAAIRHTLPPRRHSRRQPRQPPQAATFSATPADFHSAASRRRQLLPASPLFSRRASIFAAASAAIAAGFLAVFELMMRRQ